MDSGPYSNSRNEEKNYKLARFFERYFEEFTESELYFFKQNEHFQRKYKYHVDVYNQKNIQNFVYSLNYTVPIEIKRKLKLQITVLNGLSTALQKLSNLMIELDIEELNSEKLRKKSKKRYFELLEENNTGGIYTMCYQEGIGSGPVIQCAAVQIPIEAQVQINNFFLSAAEDNKMESSPQNRELRELNALRMASKVLEDNSFLKDDKGGWYGNARKTMRNGSALTRCGSETNTYISFIWELIDTGLIKSLYFRFRSKKMIERDTWLGTHQAVLITGIHTKKRYVIDSWYENGGEMAHISKESDWLNGDYDRNIVPGRESYEVQ